MRSKAKQLMQLPSNYLALDEEEMRCIVGGSHREPMREDFLNKQYCADTAAFYLYMGMVSGMSQMEIAQELYAHAMGYYCGGMLKAVGIADSVADYLISHGAYIDLEDGGDTAARKAAYATIWFLL